MLTLRLGCRVCATRPAVVAVLKRSLIQVMQSCSALRILQVHRISPGRQGELVQCTFASLGYLEVSQPPKVSNDGKQQLSKFGPLTACLAVLVSRAVLGRITGHSTPFQYSRHCSCVGVT